MSFKRYAITLVSFIHCHMKEIKVETFSSKPGVINNYSFKSCSCAFCCVCCCMLVCAKKKRNIEGT